MGIPIGRGRLLAKRTARSPSSPAPRSFPRRTKRVFPSTDIPTAMTIPSVLFAALLAAGVSALPEVIRLDRAGLRGDGATRSALLAAESLDVWRGVA